jgi:pilus assembly protein CpaB
VDLILTHKVPGGMLASETFVEDIRVLAIDQMLDNPENKAMIAKTITLEVSPKQAEMINVAESLGSISVILRSLSNSTLDAPTPKPVQVEPRSEGDNYSTDSDVSKFMDSKGGGHAKVSVYHGSTQAEQLDFHQQGGQPQGQGPK